MGQFWPKFCSYVSRRGWIRLWPAGLNWPWAETDLFKFQFNNWTDIIQWCAANCSRLRLECFSCIMPLELLLIELRTEWHTCYSFLGSVSVSMATVIGKLGNAIKSINHMWVIPKVVEVAYGSGRRLRQLFITKFKPQFKLGFTKVSRN